jgi:hypothetical protein
MAPQINIFYFVCIVLVVVDSFFFRWLTIFELESFGFKFSMLILASSSKRR